MKKFYRTVSLFEWLFFSGFLAAAIGLTVMAFQKMTAKPAFSTVFFFIVCLVGIGLGIAMLGVQFKKGVWLEGKRARFSLTDQADEIDLDGLQSIELFCDGKRLGTRKLFVENGELVFTYQDQSQRRVQTGFLVGGKGLRLERRLRKAAGLPEPPKQKKNRCKNKDVSPSEDEKS